MIVKKSAAPSVVIDIAPKSFPNESSTCLGTISKTTTVNSCKSTKPLDGPISKTESIGSRITKKDALESDNPLDASEYADDIHNYHRNNESRAMVDPQYLKYQPVIKDEFREVLIDWLIKLHFKAEDPNSDWALSADSLFLTVNLIDRFLARVTVNKGDLQLVGVAAFFIASKYEDIYPPAVKDLIHWSNYSFTSQELYDKEAQVLKTLGYSVSLPTANTFLAGYLKVAGVSNNKRVVNIARFFLEGSLTSSALLEFLPSQLAAAAVILACDCSGETWNLNGLCDYVESKEDGYNIEIFDPAARAILEAKNKTPENILSVNEKYESIIQEFHAVTAYAAKYDIGH